MGEFFFEEGLDVFAVLGAGEAEEGDALFACCLRGGEGVFAGWFRSCRRWGRLEDASRGGGVAPEGWACGAELGANPAAAGEDGHVEDPAVGEEDVRSVAGGGGDVGFEFLEKRICVRVWEGGGEVLGEIGDVGFETLDAP